MMINEELLAWTKKSNEYQRFRICLAAQIFKHAIFTISIICLSLLNPNNLAYAQGGAGPGSYTEPRPVTGNGDFKALKAIEHLWYRWLKGPRPAPVAPAVTRIAPVASKRIAKKKPAIAAGPKLTALPVPTPSPAAKSTTLTVPAATPAEGSEIQVFWWPVPDPTVTNSQVPK
jgi:hypothetical protein